MRRNSGFTLYEMMVVIAITALLAAVTMPSFLSWLTAHRLRGAAIDLMADMEMDVQTYETQDDTLATAGLLLMATKNKILK